MKISELTVAPESTTIVSAATFGICKQNITAALAGVPTKKPRRIVKYKARAAYLEGELAEANLSLETAITYQRRLIAERSDLAKEIGDLEQKLDARVDDAMGLARTVRELRLAGRVLGVVAILEALWIVFR